MPQCMGSPVASTQTRRPRITAIRSIMSRSGLGQARRSQEPSARVGHHGEVALAADQHLGGVDQRARGGREAGKARPRRCRRWRATASCRRGSEDERVQRGRGHGAAAAPAMQRDEGKAEGVAGERRFRFRRADEADGKAQHQRRPRRRLRRSAPAGGRARSGRCRSRRSRRRIAPPGARCRRRCASARLRLASAAAPGWSMATWTALRGRQAARSSGRRRPCARRRGSARRRASAARPRSPARRRIGEVARRCPACRRRGRCARRSARCRREARKDPPPPRSISKERRVISAGSRM